MRQRQTEGVQKLPFQRQDEVTLWANSIAGLPGVEQGRRAEMVWKNPSSSQALKLRALSMAASRPGRQGYPARKELAALYAKATFEQRAAWETMYWTDLDGMDSDTLKKLAASVSSEQEKSFPWNLVMLKAARRGLLNDSSAVLSRLSNPMLYAAPAMLGLGEAPAVTPSSTVSVALIIPQTGSASALGRQVAAGAQAAVDDLRLSGKNVDLRIIDTGLTGWQQAVQNLQGAGNVENAELTGQSAASGAATPSTPIPEESLQALLSLKRGMSPGPAGNGGVAENGG